MQVNVNTVVVNEKTDSSLDSGEGSFDDVFNAIDEHEQQGFNPNEVSFETMDRFDDKRANKKDSKDKKDADEPGALLLLNQNAALAQPAAQVLPKQAGQPANRLQQQKAGLLASIQGVMPGKGAANALPGAALPSKGAANSLVGTALPGNLPAKGLKPGTGLLAGNAGMPGGVAAGTTNSSMKAPPVFVGTAHAKMPGGAAATKPQAGAMAGQQALLPKGQAPLPKGPAPGKALVPPESKHLSANKPVPAPAKPQSELMAKPVVSQKPLGTTERALKPGAEQKWMSSDQPVMADQGASFPDIIRTIDDPSAASRQLFGTAESSASNASSPLLEGQLLHSVNSANIQLAGLNVRLSYTAQDLYKNWSNYYRVLLKSSSFFVLIDNDVVMVMGEERHDY